MLSRLLPACLCCQKNYVSNKQQTHVQTQKDTHQEMITRRLIVSDSASASVSHVNKLDKQVENNKRTNMESSESRNSNWVPESKQCKWACGPMRKATNSNQLAYVLLWSQAVDSCPTVDTTALHPNKHITIHSLSCVVQVSTLLVSFDAIREQC